MPRHDRWIAAAALMLALPTVSPAASAFAAQDQAAEPPARSAPQPAPSTNVRIDLRVTETLGNEGNTGAAERTRHVTMLVAAGTPRSVESRESQQRESYLDVTATPVRVDDDTIVLELRVRLSLLARPSVAADERFQPSYGVSEIRDEFTVVLDDAVPLVVLESTGPLGDRAIIVEATATVLD